MGEEIEYRRSIASIISPIAAVLYDDDDEYNDVQGYQRHLIASLKVTSAFKVKISAIALENIPTPRTFIWNERHSAVTETELSNRWLVSLAQATATLKSITQNIVRSAVLPLGRR